jgi:capsular polysaccharide biosynthesis protein
MTKQIELKLTTIRTLYPTFATPFHIGMEPSYSILRARKALNIASPDLQAGIVECAPLSYEQSEVSFVYLPNSIVTQTGAVIFREQFLIEETLEGTPALNGFVEHQGNILLSLDEIVDTEEVCFLFGKYGTFNYSIFIAEMLPAAYLASIVPSLESLRSPIFFPDFMSQAAIESRFEMLSAVGLPRNRVFLNPNRATRYKGVVICKVNDRYRNYRISQLMPEVSAALKASFATSNKPIGRKIYVTRKNAPSRRIRNFAALEQAVLNKYAFTQVDLDRASLTEQIDAFSKADCVLAEHGAGLANAMFMRPGSTIIEIFPKPMVGRYMYRVIANNLKLNYAFGCMDVEEGWRWSADDLTVDVPLYDQLVSRALEQLP